jgi:hypothetical protein
VYFDCWLDLPALRAAFALPAVVEDHVHKGTHDGEERGLVCSACHDAVVGRYSPGPGVAEFRG